MTLGPASHIRYVVLLMLLPDCPMHALLGLTEALHGVGISIPPLGADSGQPPLRDQINPTQTPKIPAPPTARPITTISLVASRDQLLFNNPLDNSLFSPLKQRKKAIQNV